MSGTVGSKDKQQIKHISGFTSGPFHFVWSKQSESIGRITQEGRDFKCETCGGGEGGRWEEKEEEETASLDAAKQFSMDAAATASVLSVFSSIDAVFSY